LFLLLQGGAALVRTSLTPVGENEAAVEYVDDAIAVYVGRRVPRRHVRAVVLDDAIVICRIYTSVARDVSDGHGISSAGSRLGPRAGIAI